MRFSTLLSAGFMLITMATAVAQTSQPSKAPPPPHTAQTPKAAVPTIDQYSDEATAKSHCGADTVVWTNLNSKVWHIPGDKFYGKTKHGAFMCQGVATKDGIRAAKG